MKNFSHHILVVDDEQEMCKELVALLKGHGFTVDIAHDGEEGLKKLLTDEFDLALVDLKMPKMDGLSMIQQAKENHIHIPMAILTGKGDTKDAFEASRLGVEKWLTKSDLNGEELIDQLSRLIPLDDGPPLTKLSFKNLTLFSEATFELSPQLNIFIGENATGKTHLLKMAYSILATHAERGQSIHEKTTPMELATAVSGKLIRVFRAEQLSHLVRHQQTHCEITVGFDDFGYDTAFRFFAKNESLQLQRLPEKYLTTQPIFLPTHDLLMIFPNFINIYENYYLEFEETWRDTCVALGGLKQRKVSRPMQKLLAQLETWMGGKIALDKNNGRFYLDLPEKGRLEVPLIAEGQRKLAMLAQLIMTGALRRGYLFWDEPEAHLNPKLIKNIAPTLLTLCAHGVQIFMATHSLFLLREIEVCLAHQPYRDVKVRWFSLHKQEQVALVEQGDSIDDIGNIAVLDEELAQSDRFMANGES